MTPKQSDFRSLPDFGSLWQSAKDWLSRPWVVALLIFLLAAIPRTVALDAFLAVDENDTWAWSNAFLQALARGDFRGTIVGDGYPGITAFWLQGVGVVVRGLGGALLGGPVGLDALLGDPGGDVLGYIVARRLPIALTNALLVSVFYLLARRLVGGGAAALGALLLAWDPFFVADGRLMRSDALLAALMSLSLLALLIYEGERRIGWLLLSGALAGASMLAKSTAVFLAPFCGLVMLVEALRARGEGAAWVWQVFRSSLLWGLAAVAVYVALWPGLWVAPGEALGLVVGKAALSAGTPHELGSFFWGQPRADPGPLFYPVAFLLRATPLMLLGLLIALIVLFRVGAVSRRRNRQQELAPTQSNSDGARWAGRWLLAYGLLFALYLTLGTKKHDRYLLVIFPAAYLLAAFGFRQAGKWAAHRGAVLAGLVLLALAQGLTLFPHHPHYLTYYNPVFGGGAQAVRSIPVGSGEGLELAARYLDAKAGAEDLQVASWYSWQFGAFFRGETGQLYQVEPALAADYAVFYVNQVQRQRPAPELVSYFQSRPPEWVARLRGVDYAWVYAGPIYGYRAPESVQHTSELTFGDGIRLVGYDAAREGGTLHVTLYWQALAAVEEDYNVYLRLADAPPPSTTSGEGEIWGQVDRQPVAGLWPMTRWQPGMYVVDEYDLPIEPGTPPGGYVLQVGVYSFRSGQVLGRGELGEIAVSKPASFPAPDSVAMQQRMKRKASGPIALLGYDFAAEKPLQPGEQFGFVLYWQARQEIGENYRVSVQLLDKEGRAGKGWHGGPVRGRYGTQGWRRGEIVRDPWRLAVPANLESGSYQLVVSMAGDSATLGAIEVQSRPRSFSVPPVDNPLQAELGGLVELLGYELQPERAGPGETLSLTLYWRALAEMDTPYTVFVHLVDGQGQIWGQRDSQPGGGTLPTTGWVAGEVITDRYEIAVGGDAPPGEYLLVAGMYDAVSGRRLGVVGPGQGGDRIILKRLQVERR